MYLIFDGGNGGPNVNKGYGSFHIYDVKNGNMFAADYREWSTPMTNNEAEYNTLIAALEYIKQMHMPTVMLVIEGDSELVRQQVLGNWKVKESHLKPLHQKAIQLLKDFKYKYNHIPRNEVVKELGH